MGGIGDRKPVRRSHVLNPAHPGGIVDVAELVNVLGLRGDPLFERGHSSLGMPSSSSTKATPARVKSAASAALGSSAPSSRRPGDVADQNGIVRRRLERRQPFAALHHLVGAVRRDEVPDELGERPVRRRFGDQPEQGAAGIISAMLVALLGARHAAADGQRGAFLDRVLQRLLRIVARVDRGDGADGEQVGAALGDPGVARDTGR